ncbi:YwmB family TATA-box binding protein [Paenibacillus sp. 276b]|uniref:YwmB family TATA-box binding protein n=1 Tax=Paenibacillus sp. 276b TaxID=1566277 RepID=UPI00089CD01E|nr:YwmB family TATA-box binding protein [Paenibacillus sp. 276b]SEB27165.1 TATA-box binding [Paenibacillus sp. 276b]
MLNRWMTVGTLALAIIILVGMTHVYAEKTESEAGKLEQLMKTADTAIDHVERLVIKWQGEGRGDAKDQAELLAHRLGLQQPEHGVQTGHDVYRSEMAADAQHAGILVNVVVTGENEYYAIVQLSGNEHTDQRLLTTLHEQVSQLLTDSGMKAAWNFAVQGTGAMESGASSQLQQIEQQLSGDMNMQAIERYTDNSTASVSYEASDLPIVIKSGTHLLNMQLAVHQDDEKGTNRVTVGFPVITIEY